MGILDRAIAALSPERGLKRAQARAAIARVTAYTAGQSMPRGRAWSASSKGPNAEVGLALRNLRKRSREMVRDNPYAARAVAIRVAQEIGYGIRPRSKTGEEALDKRVEALFEEWTKRSDYAGGLDWYGQQALAARTRCEAGEVLLRLVHLNPAEARRRRMKIPLQIEVLEPDLLEEVVRFGPTPGTDRTIQGIEHDANGLRTAYRILRRHPGEGYGFTGSALDELVDRIPAEDIIHLWRRFNARPQQVRGVPDSAPALLRLQRLDEYEEATLEGAKVQALLGVFITTPEPLDMPVGPGPVGAGYSGPAEPGDQRSIPTELWPGMVANIPVGSEPKFLQPSGAGSFEPFALHTLMSIATAYGVTYDQLTGDLRQANYSSLRAGKIEFRRLVEQDQWLMHIPLMCQPIWDAFIDAAVLAGALPERGEGYPVEWTPPKFEAVDPLKDGNAVIAQIRSGLMTWSQAVSEMGFDPRVQADDIAKSNKLLDDRGIVLDSDPRRVSNAGGAQDARQNAAVEIAGRGITPLAAPGATPAEDPVPADDGAE